MQGIFQASQEIHYDVVLYLEKLPSEPCLITEGSIETKLDNKCSRNVEEIETNKLLNN